ncbi:FAD-binding protein [Nocardiopsis sp. NPDC049922]|uniref:FAD-dependent oxidoreductase n=1 Tax=Nocardiopsis sp. NPDC049922 TaxID=3155157 RepID=UPI003408D994
MVTRSGLRAPHRVWHRLGRSIAGEIVLPDQDEYDAVRGTADPRFDAASPRAVVRCAVEDDVVHAVDFARRWGIRAHVRAGGHCAIGSSTGPGLVIDLSPLTRTVVDGGSAWCAGGTLTGAFTAALDGHGRTVPTGRCTTVGVAGHTLGGGTGPTGRRYGFTLDSLTGARVVLGDGRVVDCDADHHPDLFWALRGAGHAAFGVVTGLRFRTRPARPVTEFVLGWPADCRARVLAAWQAWGPHAPDELSTTATIAGATVRSPGDGRSPATVTGSWLGDPVGLEHLVDDLLAAVGRPPKVRTGTVRTGGDGAPIPAVGGSPLANGGPDATNGPGVVLRRHEFFDRPLDAAALDAVTAALDRGTRPGEARRLRLEAMGGAYDRSSREAAALAHHGALFGALSEFRPAPGGLAGCRTAQGELHGVLRPLAAGTAHPNYPSENRKDWRRAYHGTRHARLEEIRVRYDPDGVFGFPMAQAAAHRSRADPGDA